MKKLLASLLAISALALVPSAAHASPATPSSCPKTQFALAKVTARIAAKAVSDASKAVAGLPATEARIAAARANLQKLTTAAREAEAARLTNPADKALADKAQRAKLQVATQKAAIKAGEAKVTATRKALPAAISAQKRAQAKLAQLAQRCTTVPTTIG